MQKFLIQFDLATGKYALSAVEKHPDGRVTAATNVMFKVTEPGERVDPFWYFDSAEIQALADQLWEAGVKPTGAMRAIAAATQQAGGAMAPWLMKQLEKFIDQATKENQHAQG